MRAPEIILALAVCLRAAGQTAVTDAWVVNPAAQAAAPGLRAVLPNVQRVRVEGGFVVVESAGIALQSLGALEAGEREAPLGPRHFVYRIPLSPKPAATPSPTPLGLTGAFLNGVPIFHPVSALSWRDQDLWHLDAVAAAERTSGTKAPRVTGLLGFALDGYPVYGASAARSSYQLRKITKRTVLPDGTELTPAQEGPPVSTEYPLGSFAEDYEFVPGSGDLDEHNGRTINGKYAYFLTEGYPHLIGPTYAGEVEKANPISGETHVPDTGNARMITPHVVDSGAPTPLIFRIPDSKGREIPYLEKVHEKPIHLVIVSEDLADFAHIHPERGADGIWRVSHTFPRGGLYTLYADYTPPGGTQTIARFELVVGGPAGKPVAAPAPVLSRLTLPAELTTGRDLRLRFDLSQTDLEPYLGAWAHIMIVSEDRREFIHAHPLEDAAAMTDANPWQHSHAVPGPGPAVVETVTGFRRPGLYRLWAQFQRRGEVITETWSFRVGTGEVVPGEVGPGEVLPAKAADADAIRIHVSATGFSPARLEIPAGKPARLAFDRPDAQNCAGTVVFPELGIRKALPPGEVTVIEIPAGAARTLHFACGMNMLRGELIVR